MQGCGGCVGKLCLKSHFNSHSEPLVQLAVLRNGKCFKLNTFVNVIVSFLQADVKVGSHVSAVRQNPLCPSQVGTGGQKNDLKLWDLNRPEEPIFRAKNVMRS